MFRNRKGKHQRPYLKPKNKMCRTCNKAKEGEIHFVLICPIYQETRDTFLSEMKTEKCLAPILYRKRCVLRDNIPKETTKEVVKCVEDCFKMRFLVISKMST